MDHGRSDIWIDAPPQDVYRYLADFRLHPRWRPQLSVEPTPAGPASVGDSFVTRGRHPERHRPNQETVTRLEPDELVEYEGHDQTIGTFHHAFSLAPDDGGTRVTRTAAVSFRWGLLRLLRPLVYRTLVPHMLRRDLEALRRCVEADRRRSADVVDRPTEP